MKPHDIIDEAEGYVNAPSMSLRMLTIALEALSSRALVWVASIGAGTLWALVMLDPSWLKIITAVGFCVTVLAPILMRDAKGW